MQRPLRQHAISNAPRILCLLVMLCASQARAEITYKEGEGWSFQGWLFDNLNLSTSSVASNSTEQLKIGLQFEKNGDEKKAVEAYRAVLKHFPLAPEAPLAVLRVAQIQDKRGDYERAFQFYDTYLEKYPEGDDFKAALDSMVKIAKI
jgi:outer membrane protein assembly factor BamD